jgi:DNA-binding IclR family transcriptional regulator
MARPAPAVARALQVLDLLVTHPSERFTLSEVVRRTGMSLGSAHAVLAVLEGSGYVVRHPVRRTYTLGPAVIAAGTVALEHTPATRVALDEAAALAKEIGREVLVTAVAGSDILCVGRSGTPTPHGPVLREGERVPLMPPLGAVFLAWAERDHVDAWLARAPSSETEQDRGRRMLDVVRSRGYAIGMASLVQQTFNDTLISLTDDPRRSELRRNLDELLVALSTDDYELASIDPRRTYDIGMIAAPVFDGEGRVTVAISATGFPPAMSASDLVREAERVRDSAVLVTKMSRGRLPA